MLCISPVSSSFAAAVSSMNNVQHVEYLSTYMFIYMTVCSILDNQSSMNNVQHVEYLSTYMFIYMTVCSILDTHAVRLQGYSVT